MFFFCRPARLPLPAAPSGRARHILLLSGVSVAAAISYSLLPDRAGGPSPLAPSRFTPTTLVESIDVSPNTKLVTLAVPPHLFPRDPSAFAPICTVFIKDSDIQVERPYTPLEGIDENGHIMFWVKRYERGEVSRWLHSRQVGDAIDIRGPVKTWSALRRNGYGHWDRVVLISGGTGITPFYQLLHDVFKTRDTSFNARFTLLHGSRSSADLPPSSMIQSLASLSQKYPDRFQLHLFAESTNDTSVGHFPTIQPGRIAKSVIQDALGLAHRTPWWRRFFHLPASTPVVLGRRTLVLVCGPEEMVSAIAGPYGRNYSQGEVGGILGELGLQSHQVWKL